MIIANFLTPETPEADLVAQLPGLFPHHIEQFSSQRHLAQKVRALATEARERSDGTNNRPALLFFLLGVQRMKILREEDDSQSYDDTSDLPSTFFAQMMKEGAEGGIHMVVTCDMMMNASRCFDRRMMNQFGLRVATGMSDGDSSNFLDSPAAAKLARPHRALFFDESKPGLLEKFIPFGLPTEEFLQTMQKAFHRREGSTS